MFLGQADTVYPIGGTTDCPDDYDYSFADSMCHLSQQSGFGNCTAPLVWSNISQNCVLAVGSTGSSPLPWNYILIGGAILLLLSFAGGRSSGKSSGYKAGYGATSRPRSRTTTRTVFA